MLNQYFDITKTDKSGSTTGAHHRLILWINGSYFQPPPSPLVIACFWDNNPVGGRVTTTLIRAEKMLQSLLSEKNSADAALSGWQKMLSKAG